MTEQEAIKEIKRWTGILMNAGSKCVAETAEAQDMAIAALEKQIAKKPICVQKPYSEEVGLNDEWNCPKCGAYVGYFTEAMYEPEQMEYCVECGQHIARDWSDI